MKRYPNSNALTLTFQYLSWSGGFYAGLTLFSAVVATLQIYIVANFIDVLQSFLVNQADASSLIAPTVAFFAVIFYE